MEFNQLKQDVLDRAKKCQACQPEYKRAYKSESKRELLQVIVDNIVWAYKEKMLDTQYMIDNFSDLFEEFGIYTTGLHEFKDKSVTLLGSSSATIETLGSSSATIKTLDSSSATIKTWGSSSATIETLGSSSATIETWGSSSATIKTLDSSSATYELKGDYSTIKDLNKLKLFVKKSKFEIIEVE